MSSRHSSASPENEDSNPEPPTTSARKERTEGVDPANQLSSKRKGKVTEKAAVAAAAGSKKRKARNDEEEERPQQRKKKKTKQGEEEDDPIVIEDMDATSAPSKKTNISNFKTASAKDGFFKKLHPGKSDETILAEQINEWKTSDKTTTYLHYNLNKTQIIRPEKDGAGAIQYRFYCKTHPSKYVTRARYDTSTANLARHVRDCSAKIAEPAQRIDQYAVAGAYSRGKLRLKAVYWVSCNYRPFKAIEDQYLREMFTVANGAVQLVSADTLARDVQDVYNASIPYVARYLQRYKGRLHYSFDGWSAGNSESYMGLIVHKLNGIEMESFMLDFIYLKKSHTGEYMAEEFLACLAKFGVTLKTFGLIGDNGANNDTMIAEIDWKIPSEASPAGKSSRLRCILHIFNLNLKAITSVFKPRKKIASDADIDDDEEEEESDDEEEEEEDDVPEDETEAQAFIERGERVSSHSEDPGREEADERALEDAESDMGSTLNDRGVDVPNVSAQDQRLAQSAFKKARKIAKKIHYSTQLKHRLQDICKRRGIPYKSIKRIMEVRWNTLCTMLESIIPLRDALDELCDHLQYTASGQPKWGTTHKGNKPLKGLKLLATEWSLFESLLPLLQRYRDATLDLEGNQRPLLHEVIRYMDAINRLLEDFINDNTKPAILRWGAALGLTVLDKYYSKTDETMLYRGAMIMHPRYKLAYFRREKWPQEWIDAAIQSVRSLWIDYYKPTDESEGQQRSVINNVRKSRFLEDDDVVEASTGDAFGDWITSDIVSSAGARNPISWWSSDYMKENTWSKPLQQMALDILSCPATSCDAERGFSRGGLMVSKRRYALSSSAIRSALCLSYWVKVPGLIPEDDIIKMFNDKKKRTEERETVKKIVARAGEDNEAIDLESDESSSDANSDK